MMHEPLGIWEGMALTAQDSDGFPMHWDAVRTGIEVREELELQQRHMLGLEPIWAFLDPAGRSYLANGVDWETAGFLLEAWARFSWSPPNSKTEVEGWERMRDCWADLEFEGSIPVGIESVVSKLEAYSEAAKYSWDRIAVRKFAESFAPFDANEVALLTVTAREGRTTCTAFCLAQPLMPDESIVKDWDDSTYRNSGDTRFYIVGDPEIGRLPEWRDAVRGWWASTSGKIVKRPGRPRGSTNLTQWEVEVRLRNYLDSLAPYQKPKRADFLAYGPAPIPISTWNDYMTRWNTNWTNMLKSVKVE